MADCCQRDLSFHHVFADSRRPLEASGFFVKPVYLVSSSDSPPMFVLDTDSVAVPLTATPLTETPFSLPLLKPGGCAGWEASACSSFWIHYCRPVFKRRSSCRRFWCGWCLSDCWRCRHSCGATATFGVVHVLNQPKDAFKEPESVADPNRDSLETFSRQFIARFDPTYVLLAHMTSLRC